MRTVRRELNQRLDEQKERLVNEAEVALRSILAGETTALVLNQALSSEVPPALEQLGRLVCVRVLDLTRYQLARSLAQQVPF